MKILLTGGTGFLGKHLLRLLVEDQRVERVDVLTRSKTTHPHSKVRVVRADLSEPNSIHALPDDSDCVIHLAGLYDFREPFFRNYSENVLGTLNLLSKMRVWNQTRRVPLLFASSYAVQFGAAEGNAEAPLKQMPAREIPYAHTKAVAERAVSESGVPGAAFRLGILVGALDGAPIEKVDGPYALLQAFASVKKSGLEPAMRYVPILGRKDVVLPLVPVDAAARVFHTALFDSDIHREDAGFSIYGTYDPTSISVAEFCETVIPKVLPKAELAYFEKVPKILLAAQEKLTHIPAEVFRFSLEQTPLSNQAFAAKFPACRIPHFSVYVESFLSGFLAFQEGRF